MSPSLICQVQKETFRRPSGRRLQSLNRTYVRGRTHHGRRAPEQISGW